MRSSLGNVLAAISCAQIAAAVGGAFVILGDALLASVFAAYSATVFSIVSFLRLEVSGE